MEGDKKLWEDQMMCFPQDSFQTVLSAKSGSHFTVLKDSDIEREWFFEEQSLRVQQPLFLLNLELMHNVHLDHTLRLP